MYLKIIGNLTMNLIVLTKQFGDYTGATVSTIEILRKISQKFNNVVVVTLKSQNIDIPNVEVIKVNSYFDALKEIKKRKSYIGYSDDHLGFLFSIYHIKYIHTYHGNWPDAKYISLLMFIKSIFFVPLYKMTIRHAAVTVSVSKYMQRSFVGDLAKDSVVIYNGIKQDNKTNNCNSSQKNGNLLMVGNVDKRKYKRAIKLFDLLDKRNFDKQIDIYGRIVDKRISQILSRYSFVNIKGVTSRIDYKNYSALISTSSSENLPVSIVESLCSCTPVISFNVGGVMEVVKNKVNGFIIQNYDYSKFVDQIYQLRNYDFNMDSNQIKQIFNWNNASKKYLEIISEIYNKDLIKNGK